MNIYIGNISHEIDDSHVTELFSEYGEIKSLRLTVEKGKSSEKQIVFVHMEDDSLADKAIISLKGQKLDGNYILLDVLRDLDVKEGLAESQLAGAAASGGDDAEDCSQSSEMQESQSRDIAELQETINKLTNEMETQGKMVDEATAEKDKLVLKIEAEHAECIELKKQLEIVSHNEAQLKKSAASKLGAISGTEDQAENLILEIKSLKHKLALALQKTSELQEKIEGKDGGGELDDDEDEI